jgi:hypothetical protein
MKNIYFSNFKFLYFFYFSIFKNHFLFCNLKKNLTFIKNFNIKKNLTFIKNFNIKKNFNKNYFFFYFNNIFTKTSNLHEKSFYNFNYLNYKNLINILYNFNINNFKYLIFDNNSYLHNLYTNLYNFKNLLIYKNYFYINPKYFTHKNFTYLYNQFLIDNKIYLLIIFNIKNILNFSHILEKSNIILFIFNKKFFFLNNNYNIFKNLNNYTNYFFIILFNHL